VTTDPGTQLVPWTRPEPPALGMTGILRRVTDLGLGAAGLALRASVEAIERFVPEEPGEEDAASAGAIGEVLRLVPGALMGVGFTVQRAVLDVSAEVERRSARVAEVVGRPRLLRRPLETAEGYLGRWHARGVSEQARNQALLAEFARRLAPAVAEAVLTRLDLSQLVEQMPIEAVMERVDLDALLARVDMDAVLDRIDVDALLDRIDVEGLLDRIDVQRIVQRVDVDALVQRVDVDAIVARVDVDSMVARLDMAPIVDELDIANIVRESTNTVGGDLVDGARVSAMRVDRFVARFTDRVLLRRRPRELQVGGAPPGSQPPS
jgi:hypothetical protein